MPTYLPVVLDAGLLSENVQGKDMSVSIKLLQQENSRLREQLESQYSQMIQMAETVQQVHMARINEAAKSEAAEAGANQKISQANKEGDAGASFLVSRPAWHQHDGILCRC